MKENWTGSEFTLTLGNAAHGGFAVGRHEGRVVFTRHGLPGETVRARVTEDPGKSFCRAEAVEILDAADGRIDPVCPISGPGGAGCCDYSFATPELGRAMKSFVVAEQLQRIAHIDRGVSVGALPGGPTGWRTRVRLAVDEAGHAGYHRYHSSSVVTELACPQVDLAAYEGLSDVQWKPGAQLQIALDSDGARSVVEIEAPAASSGGRGRRAATARRSALAGPLREEVAFGSGRAVERVGSRAWDVSATGFWQAHRAAPEAYSQLVAEWAQIKPGQQAWDLYGGSGVFAAALAERGAVVDSVESAEGAVADGRAALADLPDVRFHASTVERAIGSLPLPDVVVLDPPRAGAGKEVIAAVADADPHRIVHIGCDPASFARDLSLYLDHGYKLAELKAFDAFPLTHHVECAALLTW